MENQKLRRNKKMWRWLWLPILMLGVMFGWSYFANRQSETWEKIIPLRKTDQHQYALKVRLAPPIYAKAVASSIEGTVEITRDGVSLAELTADPMGRTGVNFTNVSYVDSYRIPEALMEAAGVTNSTRNFDPKINLVITPAQTIAYDNEKDRRLMTYAYSPQATKTWTYDYKDQTDKISGVLTFTRGYVNFGYVYGDAQPGAKVNFRMEVTLGGAPIVIERDVQFKRAPNWSTNVYQRVSGDVRYKVDLIPFLRKVRYFGRSDSGLIKGDEGVQTRIEKAIRVKVTAYNTRTGKIDTNPYQRVKLTAIPLFLVNDREPAAIEFPGQLTYMGVPRQEELPEYWKDILSDPFGEGQSDQGERAIWDATRIVTEDDVYLARLLESDGLVEQLQTFNRGFDPLYWMSYRQVPVEYLNATPRTQIDFDLVNGSGEALFLPNSRYGDKDVLRSYMIQVGLDDKTVEQELTKAEIDEELKDFIWPKVVLTVQPTNYYLNGYQACGNVTGLSQYTDRSLPEEPEWSSATRTANRSFRKQADIQCPTRVNSEYNFLYKTWYKGSQFANTNYTVVPLTDDMLSRANAPLPLKRGWYWPITWFMLTSHAARMIVGLGWIMWVIIKRRYAKPNQI